MAKNPTLTTGCYIIFNFVQFRICLYVYQEAKIPFNILSFYVQLIYAGQFSKVQFKRRQQFFAVALNNWAPFISTMIWKLTSRTEFRISYPQGFRVSKSDHYAESTGSTLELKMLIMEHVLLNLDQQTEEDYMFLNLKIRDIHWHKNKSR